MIKNFLSSQFLRKIDIFGVGISFRINDDNKFKTRFGGFVTLLICFLLIFMFSQSLMQIINKTNPSVIYEERILPNPTQSDLNSNNFSFVMAMLDPASQNPVADETIFRFEATFMYKDTSANNGGQIYKFKSMELERCNQNSFQVAGTQNYFLNLNYTNMYCFSNISDYYLVGQFEMDQFSDIQISFIPCDENDPTNNVTCMEQKQRETIISRSYLQVYYSTKVVEVSNYKQPFQSIGVSSFWSLNMAYLNSVSMLYQKTYIEDDNGLFTQSISTQESLLYSSQNSQLQGKTGYSIFEISLYLEKNKEQYYTRQYMKIPQAFSEIGGIFNILFAIGCLLSQPYSQMQLNRTLFNSAFYIKKNNNEKDSQKNQKQEKNQKINSNYLSSPANANSKLKHNQNIFDNSPQLKEIKKDISNNKLKNSSQLNNKDNKKLNQGNLQHQNNNNNLEVSSSFNVFKANQNNNASQNNKSVFREKLHDFQVKTSEYFSYYFNCFNNFKQNDFSKIIHLGSQKIQNYTDVCFIVNKLIEFEKLKTLVLNDQQLKLFNFIPKPQLDSQFLFEEKIHENFSSQSSQVNNSQIVQNSSKPDQIIESENNSLAKKNPTINQNKGHKKSQFNILNIDNKSSIEKAKEAQQAFNQIYKSDNKKSKVDLKLIEMLDQNLISLFEKNIFDDKQNQNLIESIINSSIKQKNSKDFPYPDSILEKTQQKNDLPIQSKIIKQPSTINNNCNTQELSEYPEREDTQYMNTSSPVFQIYRAQPKNFMKKIENDQKNCF
ncbi:hypothetical protein ABPG74_020372 [Tetrahymena malaccensis]